MSGTRTPSAEELASLLPLGRWRTRYRGHALSLVGSVNLYGSLALTAYWDQNPYYRVTALPRCPTAQLEKTAKLEKYTLRIPNHRAAALSTNYGEIQTLIHSIGVVSLLNNWWVFELCHRHAGGLRAACIECRAECETRYQEELIRELAGETVEAMGGPCRPWL